MGVSTIIAAPPFPGEAPIGPDNWHVLATVSVPRLPAGNQQLTMALFRMQNIQGAGCDGGSASLNGLLGGFDKAINTGVLCPDSGAQHPTFSWEYDLEWTEDTYSEKVNNTCVALEQNPGCLLQQETVDSVITYSNYMPTGVTPPPLLQEFHRHYQQIYGMPRLVEQEQALPM